MLLERYEQFRFNRMHFDRLTSLGWTFNDNLNRYDHKRYRLVVRQDKGDYEGLINSDGEILFPIGEVGMFEYERVEIKSVKNFPKIINETVSLSLNVKDFKEWSPLRFKSNVYLTGSFESLKGLEYTEIYGDLYINHGVNLTSLEFCPNLPNNVLTITHTDSLKDLSHLAGKDILDVNPSYGGRISEAEARFVSESIVKNIKDYWQEFLGYCDSNKIDLDSIKNWPEGFLSKNLKRSIKGKNKFNL